MVVFICFWQVASRELNIPVSYIHTSETSTVTVPNASITAGSMGTDINGRAVQVTFLSFSPSDSAGNNLAPTPLLWELKLRPRKVNQLVLDAPLSG